MGQRVSRRPAAPSSSGGWKSRWPTWVPLALAAIAVAIAIAAFFRPMHASAPSFSSQQTADAKTHLCAAYVTVRQGVVTNTHLANPVPNDPAGQLAVAANARLALVGGGAFLQNRLTAEPAASGDLAKTVGAMANTIQELGVGYLAGLNSTLDPLRHNLDTEITDMNKLCE
ncbi:MAG: hypothetical protein WA317_08110 [Mycobacterium sp.]|uniref:hypothetical protein n=1 Tax=Mycobacterium sp. TaxID=1785 RepID=UPI003CC5D4FA